MVVFYLVNFIWRQEIPYTYEDDKIVLDIAEPAAQYEISEIEKGFKAIEEGRLLTEEDTKRGLGKSGWGK